MALENFHRVLKKIYFQRKRNKRVDHLLNALLKIARDKAFEAREKWERGKRTKKIKEINQRHKTAMLLKKDEIVQVNEQKWELPSSSNKAFYTIIKKTSCKECKMKCDSCNVCIHEYECSCPDYAIHSVPCKHVHLIHMLDTENQVNRGNDEQILESNLEDNELDKKRAYFERQLKPLHMSIMQFLL